MTTDYCFTTGKSFWLILLTTRRRYDDGVQDTCNANNSLTSVQASNSKKNDEKLVELLRIRHHVNVNFLVSIQDVLTEMRTTNTVTRTEKMALNVLTNRCSPPLVLLIPGRWEDVWSWDAIMRHSKSVKLFGQNVRETKGKSNNVSVVTLIRTNKCFSEHIGQFVLVNSACS